MRTAGARLSETKGGQVGKARGHERWRSGSDAWQIRGFEAATDHVFTGDINYNLTLVHHRKYRPIHLRSTRATSIGPFRLRAFFQASVGRGNLLHRFRDHPSIIL